MPSAIIPETGDKGLDFDGLDFDYEELERTPGVAAVSGIAAETAGSNISAESPKTNSPRGGCGAWAILSECVSGFHHFARRIVCGKEWCPDCQKQRSPAHNRRIARILPKAMQMSSVGYFVIEFPDRYRKVVSYAYSKRALQIASKKIVDTLAGKRCGRRGRVDGFFSRGLLRWHFFGDEKVGKYNPHANVLVDAGYLSPELLETIKTALRSALNCPDLIIHYGFADTPGKIFHRVEYITRATFLNYDWSPYMAEQLFGFRNQRWWGGWKGEAVWSVEDAQAQGEAAAGLLAVGSLQSGLCPDCGQPLETIRHSEKTGKAVQWSKPVPSALLKSWEAEEIAGSGYYRIPHRVWSGTELSPQAVMRLEELKAARLSWIHSRVRDKEGWWNSVLNDECSTFGGLDDWESS